MADIVPVLRDALSALKEVQAHPDVPAEYREPVDALRTRLHHHLRTYKLGQDYEIREIVPDLKGHGLRLRKAARGADFAAAVLHAKAMVAALPGPPQSLPKPPRRKLRQYL